MNPSLCLQFLLSVLLVAVGAPGTPFVASNRRSSQLQNIVTYDKYSAKINGTRVFIFSGEFHPFRLPVPGLWLDIFHKIKAAGLNAVSWYADWALLEGKQGDFSAEGVFALEPFFEAAKQAGIYLIARPGPYINAEASGGGFPGWLQRVPGYMREANPGYLDAVHSYESQIGPIVARSQITNGGATILVQPENEYSSPQQLLSHEYMQDVEIWYRQAGVVVPFISNDGYAYGNFAPGTGPGAVDIYGYDSYPLGFDCANPYTWSGHSNQYFPGLSPPASAPSGTIEANPHWNEVHEAESPNTPDHVSEYQGGSFDSWAGPGFEKCASMTGAAFERVFCKNSYSFGLKGINYYMLYGGTNWGNLGFPFGYTSYDYGAAIAEDRTITREKYSELKLQANFFKVSSAWLVAEPKNFDNSSLYADTDLITVTPLTTNTTSFWGELTILNLGGSLGLNGRDSKIMVTNYVVGEYNILYSSAEIFTWQQYPNKTLLLLCVGIDEMNEIAIDSSETLEIVEGKAKATNSTRDRTTVQWTTSPQRLVFTLGILEDRYSAYDYWVVDLNNVVEDGYSGSAAVVVKAGYLVRNATIEGSTLHLVGDTNCTTGIEVLGTPENVNSLTWNGETVECKQGLSGSIEFSAPHIKLPDLASLNWKYADSLPEIRPSYDDSSWTLANHRVTNNTQTRNLATPTSLYSTDYGFNTGPLLYRAHFSANGNESQLKIQTQGGSAFASSIWLNESLLGSWPGSPNNCSYYQNLTFPQLDKGDEYVITVLQDMMGLEESGPVGPNSTSKTPRGILDYDLDGHPPTDLLWRLTGNLGGESYHDRTRGPLNEGGLFAERQGWHQPYPPVRSSAFSSGSPMEGLPKPGVAFYTASFSLDIPIGWDVPLSFVFANDTKSDVYRVQLFVNGYQFGKYLSNLGPQVSFPVPEGILNYRGENWLALTLWALHQGGAKLQGLSLKTTAIVESGYGSPALSPMPKWSDRPGAY